MITRAQYMAGDASHEAYYLDVADAAQVTAARPELVARCRDALAVGDKHLNTIPLGTWDAMSAGLGASVSRALKARGDWLSLGAGVCVLKTVYRRAAMVRHD